MFWCNLRCLLCSVRYVVCNSVRYDLHNDVRYCVCYITRYGVCYDLHYIVRDNVRYGLCYYIPYILHCGVRYVYAMVYINVREYRRSTSNQKSTILRNWQHRVHKRGKKRNKNTTQYVVDTTMREQKQRT